MNSNELTRERESERTNACTHVRGTEWLWSIANKCRFNYKNCFFVITSLLRNIMYLLAVLFKKFTGQGLKTSSWKCTFLPRLYKVSILINCDRIQHAGIKTPLKTFMSNRVALALGVLWRIGYVCLDQWSQTQFLEGHSSAEFSSKSHLLGSF